jgi:hypothetical protein
MSALPPGVRKVVLEEGTGDSEPPQRGQLVTGTPAVATFSNPSLPAAILLLKRVCPLRGQCTAPVNTATAMRSSGPRKTRGRSPFLSR